MKRLVLLIPVLGMLWASPLFAADVVPDDEVLSQWRVGVALGYGLRTNPLTLSDDIPIIIDLDVAWFGEHWFFDNGDLGLTMLDRDRYTLNLVGRFNSDRLFFSKTNIKFVSALDSFGEPVIEQIEVPDRDYAIELGFEILADGDWGNLQASVFKDVSNTHDGYELYADYGFFMRRHRWLFQPSVGVSWKSDKLNDYYWGVRESEANSVFPAYRAGAGLNLHARFQASYQINRHWAFIATAEFERLNPEASASPIVEERTVLGVFTGFQYEY
jgi:outer membrane protein